MRSQQGGQQELSAGPRLMEEVDLLPWGGASSVRACTDMPHPAPLHRRDRPLGGCHGSTRYVGGCSFDDPQTGFECQ